MKTLKIILCLVAYIFFLGAKDLFAIDKIEIKKNVMGQCQLLVNGQLYFVRGVCYQPIPVGYGCNYNWWGDPTRIWLRDGQLMKEMGINTIRVYQQGENIHQTRRVISDLFKYYEIRTVMGHWLDWWNADYANPDFQKQVMEDVLEMVRRYQDAPGIFMWVLGNENNYSFGPQKINYWTGPALEKIEDPYEKKIASAEIYYSFVNRVAREIKKIDPVHPVVLGNGDLGTISVAGRNNSAVDILGSTCYRGKSFGNFWREVDREWRKPVILLEFGCDSYDAYHCQEDQNTQCEFIRSQWKEIAENATGGLGFGNSLGGFLFEWNDEWWKCDQGNSLSDHDTDAGWSNGAYWRDIKAERNLNMNEEWWGIMAIDTTTVFGETYNALKPRLAYYAIKELFTGRKTATGSPAEKISSRGKK